MGRRAGRIAVVLAMAAALLSCGGGGDGDDPSAATTSEATTSTTSGVDPDAPPPADLLANLYQRVDAGDWTLGEGLVASLEYLTADGSLDDIVAGGEVQTEEATGLVAAAREYTEETPDAEHADDVAALLDVVVPSPEILRALAGVDPQHGRSAQPEQDCADLWLTIRPGFEPPGNCLEVVTTTVGAMNVNLFYPKAGVDGLTRERFETKTIEGLQQAVATFGGLGRLPDYIDLAVTPVSKGAILMDAGRNKLERAADARSPCTAVARQLQGDQYEQAIADEMAHCFMHYTFEAQSIGLEAQSAAWWAEGGAEMLAEAAVPEGGQPFINNLEFDVTDKSLLDLEYQNFAWFWYVENQFGLPGVVNWLHQLPVSGGRSEQLASLRCPARRLQALPGLRRGVVRCGHPFRPRPHPEDAVDPDRLRQRRRARGRPCRRVPAPGDAPRGAGRTQGGVRDRARGPRARQRGGRRGAGPVSLSRSWRANSPTGTSSSRRRTDRAPQR